MNAIFGQLENFGIDVLRLFLATGTAEDTAVRVLSSFQDGNETKPVLVVGSVHRDFSDGNCVVILNPDESLVDQVRSGVAYHPVGLKRTVAKCCDAMLQVHVVGQRSHVVGCYRARRRRTARFAVK